MDSLLILYANLRSTLNANMTCVCHLRRAGRNTNRYPRIDRHGGYHIDIHEAETRYVGRECPSEREGKRASAVSCKIRLKAEMFATRRAKYIHR